MSYWSQTQDDDEYDTPRELWENIREYLPKKDKIVWEAFYSNGKSGNILSDLGCTVIQSKSDFFDADNNICGKSGCDCVEHTLFQKERDLGEVKGDGQAVHYYYACFDNIYRIFERHIWERASSHCTT